MGIKRIKRMKTKAKINSVLEKKVDELESLLETTTFNDIDPNLYRKIQLRILFANTLLAAEISSRPMDMEGEEDDEELLKFACMAKRLKELGESFNINQFPGHDNNGSLNEPEMGNLETSAGIVFNGETGLVYSLVESCLNESSKEEEEEEEKEEVEAEQWPLFQEVLSEDKREFTFPAVAAVKEEVVVNGVKEKGWVYFRALVCFGLIGLVGGMISLFGYIGDIMEEGNFFLTPT